MEDDIEFTRQMLRLNKDNKYGKEKHRGMKRVEKNHKIISTIPDIPESIIFQFLVRIPPRYIYKNFMPVCKSWKDMFSQRSFAVLNFTESKTELLLIQAATSAKHMRTKLIEIGKDLEPELRDLGISRLGQVQSSCDGFLLINKPREHKELQVINPTTKICITIPECPSGCQHKHKTCSVALGFDSLRKQYKVVHVVTDSYGFEIYNLSGGGGDDKQWKLISSPWEYDRPFNPIGFHWKNPVSINGRILHWYVDSSEYFISMRVNEAKLSRTHLPRLGFGEIIERGRYELVELGGFLSVVYWDSNMKMDVWILEDFDRQVWSKRHSIVAESISYIHPKNLTSVTPDLGKLVPVAGVRNGRVLILKHTNSNMYIYDTETRVMKKANINMKGFGYCIPYKDSLFSMNRIS